MKNIIQKDNQIIGLFLIWMLITIFLIAFVRTEILFTLLKCITISFIVGVSAKNCYNHKDEKCFVFYTALIGILACIGANYIINFAAHWCIKGLSAKYVGKTVLKVASLICSATCVAILNIKKIELHKLFVIVCMLLGCCYIFVLTPLSAPDEDHHYQSAYVVSNYMTFEEDKTSAIKNHVDYSECVGHKNVSSAYRRFSESLFLDSKDLHKRVTIGERYSLDYPIQHLPQAIGITIAKLLNMSFIGTFYLGRLFNLMFFSICVAFAIKILPAFREVLFIAALMPMSLHQAASCSSDSFINGLSFLLISLIISVIIKKENVEKKKFVQIAIVSALLAPAKVIYLTITFLLFLIPKDQFGNNKKKIFAIMSIIGSGVIIIFVFKLHALTVIASQNTAAVGLPEDRCYSLADIISNPCNAIKIYINTICKKGTWYFETMLGSTLSGLSIIIPRWQMYCVELFFVASALAQPNDNWTFKIEQRIFMICIVAITLLLAMTSMFLGWTPISYDYILGVQGRYLIPVMPLILFSLRNNTIISKRNISGFLIAGMFVIHCFILIAVINYSFC